MSDSLAEPEAAGPPSGPAGPPPGPRAGLLGTPAPTADGTPRPAGPSSPVGEHGPDTDTAAGDRPEAEGAHDPAAPAPLGVVRTPTGRPEVDAQLERLGDADHLATDGHLEVYEDVHQGLRDALTALDARPGPPAPPSSSVHRS